MLETIDSEAYPDDQYQTNTEESSDDILLIGMIVGGVTIIFCGIGIYGAVKYNKCLVAFAGICYCVMAIFNSIIMNWVGLILTASFAYPHFALCDEMKKGTITPDNYINEKHSCCCMQKNAGR